MRGSSTRPTGRGSSKTIWPTPPVTPLGPFADDDWEDDEDEEDEFDDDLDEDDESDDWEEVDDDDFDDDLDEDLDDEEDDFDDDWEDDEDDDWDEEDDDERANSMLINHPWEEVGDEDEPVQRNHPKTPQPVSYLSADGFYASNGRRYWPPVRSLH